MDKPFYVKLRGWLREFPLCSHCFDLMNKLWKVDGRAPSYMELVFAYQSLEIYKKQKAEEERVYLLKQRALDSLIDARLMPGGARLYFLGR